MNKAISRCDTKKTNLNSGGIQGPKLDLPGFYNGLSGMGLVILDTENSNCMLSKLISNGLL